MLTQCRIGRNIHSYMTEKPKSGGEPTGKAHTRQVVMAAAIELFATRGFHGVAVPEIAERAGVGVGTLYRHFADKTDLANEVYRQCRRTMAALTRSKPGVATAGSDDPYRAEFLIVWRRLFDFALTHRSEFHFLELHHHAEYLDAQSRQLAAQSHEPMRRFFARGIKAGAIANLPIPVLIGLGWGALVGVARQALSGALEATPEMIDSAGQAAWRAIAASR